MESLKAKTQDLERVERLARVDLEQLSKRVRNLTSHHQSFTLIANESCRYNWRIAGIGLEFISNKYAETILSNSTRKLLWFEIRKTVVAV